MKTKILLTSFILFFALIKINSQAHDNSQGACRLFKNKAIGDGATCPACVAKDKKEQEARNLENKKRQDIITAKANAERLAKEAAFKKEMAARKANEKVREVKVVMPGNTTKKEISSKKIKKSTVVSISAYKGKLYPSNINSVGILLNSKNDTIIKSTEFKTVIPASDLYTIEDMPDNAAIVEYRDLLDSEYPDSQFYPKNLIDSEMKKILSDEKISYIEYGKNDLFLIASGGSYKDGLTAKRIYMYDYLKNKITPFEAVISEYTFSPINGKGIDMTDYFDLKIIAYNISNGKSVYKGSLSKELDQIYEGNDWLLLLSQSVGYKYGHPKYKYYYVDRERNLVPVGIFDRE